MTNIFNNMKEKLPQVEKSPEWYKGYTDALDLALITQPDGSQVRGQPASPMTAVKNQTTTAKSQTEGNNE